jgi:ADP-ribose pyrophosphatase YjhB (NUDIX family)
MKELIKPQAINPHKPAEASIMEYKRPLLVASAFVKKDGKYLLIRCGKFGDWRVPGGRIEPYERAPVTIRREMKEELGIDVDKVRFVGYGQDFREVKEKDAILSRTVLYFACECLDNISPDKKEVLECKWLSLQEIKQHPNLERAMTDLFTRLNTNDL